MHVALVPDFNQRCAQTSHMTVNAKLLARFWHKPNSEMYDNLYEFKEERCQS